MDNKLQTTIRRSLGLLLAFAIALALLPQTSYAATKAYNTKYLRIKTASFEKKDTYSYKDTVKVKYPVIGYVDATVKITMKQNTYKSLVDGKLYRYIHTKVNYTLTKSAKNKIKKNAKKISEAMKKQKYNVIYPFEVFVLDSKTGKVTASISSGGFPQNYQAHKSEVYGSGNYVTAKEYYYNSENFKVTDESSFIVGIASPNKDVLSKENLKGGNANFKEAKKFWDSKKALKKSIYYSKNNKNRALYLKFYQKATETE
jgi:hypothetical protein